MPRWKKSRHFAELIKNKIVESTQQTKKHQQTAYSLRITISVCWSTLNQCDPLTHLLSTNAMKLLLPIQGQ